MAAMVGKSALDAVLEHLGCTEDALREMRGVDLSGTRVADIGPLAQCRELRMVDLDCTQVVDIGPLAQCRELRYTSVYFCERVEPAWLRDVWSDRVVEYLQAKRCRLVKAAGR